MKKYVVLSVSLLIVHVNAFSKNAMPSLKRLREKVEKALDSGSTQPFKELIEHAQKRDGGTSPVVRIGGTNTPKSDREKLQDIAEHVHNLYWSNHDTVMTALHDAVVHKKGDALSMLVEMVEQRYSEKSAPLVAFAADLEKEIAVLDVYTEQLSVLLTVRSSRDSLKADYQENVIQELELARQLTHKMKSFIELVDQILRGRA